MDIEGVAERIRTYEQDGRSQNTAIDMALSDVREIA